MASEGEIWSNPIILFFIGCSNSLVSNPLFEHLRGKRLGLFTDMAELVGEFEAFNDIRNLCRLCGITKIKSTLYRLLLKIFCGNTTNPNQRFSIFSDYGKSVKLQRLISDVAKVSVTYDDCLPQHLCRNCYRTLLNLRDKVFAFQSKCATTQVNLANGRQGVKRIRRSPKSSPSTSPAQRQKKSRFNLQTRKALFIDEKENISPSPVNDKKESVHTSTVNISAIIQNSSRCRPLETPAQQRPVPENISRPLNSGSTSAASTNNTDEVGKALNVISNSGLNNPMVRFPFKGDFFDHVRRHEHEDNDYYFACKALSLILSLLL